MKDKSEKSVYQIRCEKLAKSAAAEGMDAVLIKSMANFRYFSGFTGDNGMLLISGTRRMLFTDFRYTEQAQSQCKDFEIVEFTRGNEYAFTAQAIKEQGIQVLGFEDAHVSVAEHARMQKELGTQFRSAGALIIRLRRVKDETEIAATRRAAEISDLAFTHLLSFIKIGMREIDIALELEFFIRTHGAQNISFSPIIGGGPTGALPHGEPSERKVANGDLVVLDFGSRVDGYCSDMTRTVGIGNVASDLKNVYTICLKAQLSALSALKAGIRAADVDAVARSFIEQAGYGKNFGHGLGHGTGLEIHEAPTLSPPSVDVLEANNLVTIEPGIYLPGIAGVRIEDLCIVTQDGFVNLCSSPKDLIIL